MLEENESTRRHFDIVVEQVKSERNLGASRPGSTIMSSG